MPLQRGTRLGPYEIMAPLGAGGMGEVYRARDPRLARDVAVKVLPAAMSKDPERLRRFQQEAKAAGGLNHPNVLALYDVGIHEGLPYVVSELLEGDTLREKLGAGPLAPRRVVDWAVQIAQGLAAAHDKGIVHRDLKPENVFVTRDGRLKILDFGLAKLADGLPSVAAPDSDVAPTAAIVTPSSESHPGLVVGTAGYMSPEQVRGQAVDHRSDIFSFGAILYEMLTGRRAFKGASAVETMSAILKEEPPDLEASGQPLPAGFERLVRHCLEKNPEERFQSARDLAFGLQAVSGLSGLSGTLPALPGARRRTVSLRQAAAGAVLLALLAAALFVAGRRSAGVASPVFRQLTFKRGAILRARFAPDGQTVVYGAAWDGRPFQVFVARPGSPESRPLELAGADILALSRGGEMALALGQRFRGGFQFSGTLARAPLAGGAPREVLEDVFEADWAPDGSLAVVRTVSGRDRLEFPIGNVRFEANGWISHPRVAPGGGALAFVHHPVWPDDGGDVMLVELAGGTRTLAAGFSSIQGLAWSPRGEVWFTAAEQGKARALYGVSRQGRSRLVLRAPGRLTLQDVAPDGRLLLSRDVVRFEIAGRPPGADAERDLSWLDGSLAQDLSDDGRTILFSEGGEGGGAGYGVYVRGTDGSAAVRLGEGLPTALSPDGRWALTLQRTSPPEIVLLPTGAGEPKRIPRHGLADYLWVHWLPDGKALVINAAETGHGFRSYVQELEGGPPRPVTPEGLWTQWVSPDGERLAVSGTGTPISIQSIGGGDPRPVAGALPSDRLAHWGRDGSLYVFRREDVPCRLYRLDPASGRRELFRTLSPADPSGVVATNEVQLSSDLRAYTYAYLRILSELYLVEGPL